MRMPLKMATLLVGQLLMIPLQASPDGVSAVVNKASASSGEPTGQAAKETTAPCSEKERKSLTVSVTDANFKQEVRQAQRVVLLDFWAEWCIPCLELEPILEELAHEFKTDVKICKINVDENPGLTAEFVPDRIFPCLILMQDGKVMERRYGTDPSMKPETFLRTWFQEATRPKKQNKDAVVLGEMGRPAERGDNCVSPCVKEKGMKIDNPRCDRITDCQFSSKQ